MISQSLQASELSAPPPRWAVGLSLVLIVLVTSVLILALPNQAQGDFTTTARAIPARAL